MSAIPTPPDDLQDPEVLWSTAIELRQRAKSVRERWEADDMLTLADDLVRSAVRLRLAAIADASRTGGISSPPPAPLEP